MRFDTLHCTGLSNEASPRFAVAAVNKSKKKRVLGPFECRRANCSHAKSAATNQYNYGNGFLQRQRWFRPFSTAASSAVRAQVGLFEPRTITGIGRPYSSGGATTSIENVRRTTKPKRS